MKDQSKAMFFLHKSTVGVGDALLFLASMCYILSDQAEIDVVAERCQEFLQGGVAGDDRLMTIIAGCA
jgi:hypothetical protein